MKYEYTGKLIIAGGNAKTVKGDGTEYLTAVMYLRPYKNTIGGQLLNTCANAEIAQCHVGCLNTSGRGKQNNVQNWRLGKTLRFWQEREGFMMDLINDLRQFRNKCAKLAVKPCVRLNGTSDIRWENIIVDGRNVMQWYPDIQFYDYTKFHNRRNIPENYDLTFSYSGVPEFQPIVQKAITNGMRIAVVYRSKEKVANMIANGENFMGMSIVDGDSDDLRFLNPKQGVVALYAKGKAKLDKSGFVVD